MVHTMNLSKVGLHNFKLGGAELEDIILWIDSEKVVPLWSRYHDRCFHGRIVKRTSGYELVYETKFSAEAAAREGCIPLTHDFPGDGTDFSPAAWKWAEALLIPRYEGDELKEGERLVYSLQWGKYVKVKLGAGTAGRYCWETGKYHHKSLGWVIIEEM